MSYIFFNPCYQLRQDGNRVILYGKEDNEYQSEDWFSFIHPFHAMMFSFFDGREKSECEIKKMAHFFSLPYDECVSIVNSYVNCSQKCLYSDGDYYFFPKNVLIEQNKPLENRVFTYEVSDFRIDGKPDLITMRTHFPVSINLELTMKCYVDCCYCYANRKIQSNGQMTTTDIVDLIKKAKASGVLNFDINGGEVLMHPGIYDIISTLHECGYQPLISTKIPVDFKILHKLKSCGVSRFQISLDSVDEGVLKCMVKAPSGYVEAMSRTLSEATSMHLKVAINVVLTIYNCKVAVIRQLFDFLSLFSCIDAVRLNVCGYSIYKGSANYYKIRPSQNSISSIESFTASDYCKKYSFKIHISGYEKQCLYESSDSKKESFEHRSICTGNLRNLVILPNGDVTICEELYDNPHFIIGNVLQSSLEDIWNSDKALKLFYNPCSNISKSACYDCDIYNQCRSHVGVCWKSVLMAYGDENWDFPDPRCPKAPFPFNEFFIK